MDIKVLMDCIKNPIKSQILFYLQKHQSLTAKDLLKMNPTIPQATLYRTLKKMEQDNVITVASTAQRRGVVEKTYTLSEDMNNIEESISSTNDGALYMNMFSNFITTLLSEFDDYSKKEHIDIANDGSGFSAIPIYATTEELIKYGYEIQKILEPAFVRKNSEQELHTFATIITPPRKDEN